MFDPLHHPRLCELLERRLGSTLGTDEEAELEVLLDTVPGARTAAAALERDQRVMNQTIESAVEHFDFVKARRAVDAKLRSNHASLMLQAMFGALAVTIAAITAVFSGQWGGVWFAAAAALLAMLGWALIVARQRSVASSMSQNGEFEPAFARHLSNGRNEFTILRAVVILGGVGMIVLFIDGLLHANVLRMIIPVLVLVFVGPPTARLMFRKGAITRHDRFLTGELSASAWMTGKDETK